MSISEQVKELRKLAGGSPNYWKVFDEAADTIESLSAKLADMERPAEDCGAGWIKKDKLIKDLIPILNEHGDMYFAGRIIGLIDSQVKCTQAADKQ